MVTTASDLIEETKAHLGSGSRIELNYLNGSIDAATQVVTVQLAAGGIQRGAVLAVDLELMNVFSMTGQIAFVKRAYLGSTAATHADDAIVEVNPWFSSFAILRAINAELASYSSPTHGLFRLRTVDITYSASRAAYDLTSVTDLIDVYDVRYAEPGSEKLWPRIRRWNLARNQSTTDFASGYALTLYEGAAPGRTIRVQYKAPFVALAALADNVQTVSFLPATANDIPPLGAAARLVAPREVRRADYGSQPEPRRAEDVPPGTARNAAAGLLALRNQRLMEESDRLRSAYPHLSRAV
jgi:hypothetical protein